MGHAVAVCQSEQFFQPIYTGIEKQSPIAIKRSRHGLID
jgi:hypothetical protein